MLLAFLAVRPIFPFVDVYLYLKGNATQLLKLFRANQAPLQELVNYLHLAELLGLSHPQGARLFYWMLLILESVKAVYFGLSYIW